MEEIKIHCPKCHWEPDGKPYWQCTCGHNWDTFSTGGRCPSCAKVWEETQCIPHAGGCDKISPQLDWYVGLDDIVAQLKAEILERWREGVAH